jgi:TP901 family phage tail tape measure protein
MIEVADLVAKLRGEDISFSGMMTSAERKLSGLAGHTDSTSKKLSNVGLALGGLAIGLGAYTAKAAANYEQLTTVLVTGAGEQLSNLEEVRAGLLTMAGTVGENAADLAKGMYYVESAGFHGAAGLQVMQAAAEGAKIGMTDDMSVAKGLTTALTDYHLSASDAAGTTGQMIAAVSAGKTTMGEFGSSLSTVLPTASALHIPFQQIAAAMATMTAHGVTAGEAATSLSSSMDKLINPTASAKQAMLQLGVNVVSMRTSLAAGNFSGTMNMFAVAMDRASKSGMSQANIMRDLQEAFGGKEGGAVALNLVKNMAEYYANVDKVGTVQQGAAKQVVAWGLTQKDLNDQLDRTKASLNASAIMIGTALLPTVSHFVNDELNPMLHGMTTFIGQHPQIGTAILGIGATAGAIALTDKLVTPLLKALGLVGKLKDMVTGGGGGALATGIMNVEAGVVNVAGGLGGAAGGAAAAAEGGGAASVLRPALAGAAPVAAEAVVAGAGLIAAPLALGVGMAVAMAVHDITTNMHAPGYSPTQGDELKQLQTDFKDFSRMTTSQYLALNETWLRDIKAGQTVPQIESSMKGFGSITVNVHAGAVSVQGGGGDMASMGQDLGTHLADFMQQWVSAQKTLNRGAKTSLPGAAK